MKTKKPASTIDKPIIRDLSWLKFNARVLQEAKDSSNHIYDRLRFLGIFSNNQDEFFRVRVAALNRMVRLGKSAKAHLEDDPEKILETIQSRVVEQQRQFDRIFGHIIRELGRSHIFIKNETSLNTEQQLFIKRFFEGNVRTEIVPLMIESIPRMPLLNDKSIYLACVLGSTEQAALRRYALIEIPAANLCRFVLLPSEKGRQDLILLEDIIRWNLPALFAPFGFNRFLGSIIKVTRDAEFDLDYDVDQDAVEALEKGLKSRKKGKATRFVYDRAIDPGLLEYLTKRLQLSKKDNLIPGGRIHNFKDFMDFPASIFEDLGLRPLPMMHRDLMQPVRIMKVLDQKDVLLHFPYHSFYPIIDLLREAAIDPFVQSIKITCYRLAKNSKIVNALVNAARNGKQVTAVLELRARFDEAANLEWKALLEEEGVNVILGLPDMKVHAKVCLIRKRAFNKTQHYGFIGTGNFNENTAQLYGDHCLLTSQPVILSDLDRIFSFLEKPTQRKDTLAKCKTLPVSPLNTRETFLKLIDDEIDARKRHKPCGILIKLNSLSDQALIDKLGEAATAGVPLSLIVRGICRFAPNQRRFKTKVKAISIVDAYLEHSRVAVFENKGKPKVFLSSADWMVRNLDHRVEVTVPILDKEIAAELIEVLNIQLAENVKARKLDNVQRNHYVKRKEGEPVVRSQLSIYNYLLQRNTQPESGGNKKRALPMPKNP